MTIILATATPVGFVFACDTEMNDGEYKETLDTKWIHVGPWWIGCSGSAVVMQWIENSDAANTRSIGELLDLFRVIFKSNGFNANTSFGPDRYKCDFIIAKDKQLWLVDGCLFAVPVKQGEWAAQGSARMVAYGALEALKPSTLPTQNKAETVIGICAKLCPEISGSWSKSVLYEEPSAPKQFVRTVPL